MNLHQFKNTTTRRTKSLALIRCIDQQCKLRNYLFMAGIKRRSFDRKPLPLTLLTLSLIIISLINERNLTSNHLIYENLS